MTKLERYAAKQDGIRMDRPKGLKWSVWQEYESRKLEISLTAKTTEEYNRRIQEVCREMGI